MPRRKRSVSESFSSDLYDDDSSGLSGQLNYSKWKLSIWWNAHLYIITLWFPTPLIENGQPIQRNAANARERARMRVLSSAFCRLKTKLPWVPADTKLSKLDTLRLAKGYIQQLEAILAGQVLDDNLQIASGQHHNLVSKLFRTLFLSGTTIVHQQRELLRIVWVYI